MEIKGKSEIKEKQKWCQQSLEYELPSSELLGYLGVKANPSKIEAQLRISQSSCSHLFPTFHGNRSGERSGLHWVLHCEYQEEFGGNYHEVLALSMLFNFFHSCLTQVNIFLELPTTTPISLSWSHTFSLDSISAYEIWGCFAPTVHHFTLTGTESHLP